MMIDPSDELEVTWLHDRLHAVLPIDRDRALPILALASCIVFLTISVTGGLLPGLFLGVLPLAFRDRRRVEITIDPRHVTVERWVLGRPIRVRLPLHGLDISTSDADDRLRLAGADAVVAHRWGGSPESLRWLADQIRSARAAASAVEQPLPPPPELSRLRRVGSGRPLSEEDHLRDEVD